MHSARRISASTRLRRRRSRARVDGPAAAPCSAIAALERRALGAVAEELAAQARRSARAASAIAATASGAASPGSGAPRTARAGRPSRALAGLPRAPA